MEYFDIFSNTPWSHCRKEDSVDDSRIYCSRLAPSVSVLNLLLTIAVKANLVRKKKRGDPRGGSSRGSTEIENVRYVFKENILVFNSLLSHCVHTFVVFSWSPGECPVLCGGNGDYSKGACVCHPGWKGPECNLRHDECEVPDCGGHGQCRDGECQCIRGYKGKYCEEGQRRLLLLFFYESST